MLPELVFVKFISCVLLGVGLVECVVFLQDEYTTHKSIAIDAKNRDIFFIQVF